MKTYEMLKLRLKALLRPAARVIKRLISPPLHRTDARYEFRVLGTEYGGWPVIDGSLDRDSVVYSFGVGNDISFDLELIYNFGCKIEAFDPTPRCIAWLAEQSLPEEFRFHRVGLHERKQVLSFAAPARDDYVSYTVAKPSESQAIVELPVEPLDSLMRCLGHSKIDFLKMDIEGAEYPVIEDILKKGIMPKQLCVEFHHGMYNYTPEDTRKAVALLKGAGYTLHYVSRGGHEYGFHLD